MRLTTALLVGALTCIPAIARASSVTIDPTSDGYVETNSTITTIYDTSYVLAGPTPQGSDQGIIKFSTSGIDGTVSQALLSLNPYALPLWSPQVEVYGYATADGQLSQSDRNAGSILGTLTLPSNLDFGQDVFFDVTAFVASQSSSPYLAFNLRANDTDTFSSLEYNYGHPSQLLVTTVPEPGSLVLLLGGLGGIAALGARRRRGQVSRPGRDRVPPHRL